jgi:hypothetical protein
VFHISSSRSPFYIKTSCYIWQMYHWSPPTTLSNSNELPIQHIHPKTYKTGIAASVMQCGLSAAAVSDKIIMVYLYARFSVLITVIASHFWQRTGNSEQKSYVIMYLDVNYTGVSKLLVSGSLWFSITYVDALIFRCDCRLLRLRATLTFQRPIQSQSPETWCHSIQRLPKLHTHTRP